MSLLALSLIAAFAQPVQVYRDSWGVPSIVAPGLGDLYYGLGYMHVVDNAERMALNYKISRGRAGEVLGRAQLLQDGFIRGLEIEEKAEEAKLSPTGELILRAYLDGANRALSERRTTIPAWVQPFTRTDVLSMSQFINCAFPLLDLASALLPGVGSNQFAVAPKRSATGHPIVSMDPHLEWNGADGGIVWYEAGLYAPGINVRGVTVPGLPATVMGHNDHVAWSLTNNDPVLAVRYTVVTDPNDRNRYRYHGEWREFRTKQIKLSFLENGELKESTQNLRLTEWGPMVPLRSEAAYVEPLRNFEGAEQSLAMMRSRSAADLRKALGMRGLSMWNFVYGDTAGNIGYQYNALSRRRDPSFAWRQSVPGDDPKTKLGTMLTLDQLPHSANPESGLLVNANSAPWLTPVGPGMPAQWPSYVTSYGATTRYILLSDLLRGQSKITPAQARTIATDTTLPFARATIKAIQLAGATGKGIDLLKRWDGRSDFDSVGTALFLYWATQDPSLGAMAQRAQAGTPWTAEERKKAVDSLTAAETQMVRDFGRIDARWGELLRMRRGNKEIGVSGFGGLAPGFGAAVNPTGGPRRGPLAGEIIANRGSSWRMVVSLVPNKVESWSVLPYGNSHDPKSPYYANQMSLFASRRYKATQFGPDAARKSATQTITISR